MSTVPAVAPEAVRLDRRARVAAAVALAAYALVLFLLRPATPFEWDEVLFQQALDRYDVAEHSPHPPGYPVYVAAARVLRVAVRDPLLALQLVAIVSAVATLVALARMARSLGAPAAAGIGAAAITAATPAFAFHANVGLSDVPATAAVVAAFCCLIPALEDDRSLRWAAFAAALALGVRPQLIAVMAPLGLFVVIRAARGRRWAALGWAAAIGVAVTLACWLPAVLVTGTGRFVTAWRELAAWTAVVERSFRLPHAPLREICAFWLLRPFGSRASAALFWALVGVGGWRWWRIGRRDLVLVAATASATFLAVGAFTMNFTTAVRYVLPVIPFLALLAGGVLTARGRAGRVTGIAAAAVLCLSAAGWVAPVLALRREPAPIWDGLSWVTRHFDPRTTTVVYDSAALPHAKYVFARTGFDIREQEPATVYDASLRPGGNVVLVLQTPVPGNAVLFERAWRSERLRRLTRDRYYTCAVMRPPGPGEPVFSPDWRVMEGRWRLWQTGVVHLPEEARPVVFHLCAGNEALGLRQAGLPDSSVAPHACADLPLTPGRAEDLFVTSPAGIYTGTPPGEMVPLPAIGMDASRLAAAYLVPQAAGLPGKAGAYWQTNLLLANPQPRPLAVEAFLLADGRDNRVAPRAREVLAPGQVLAASDVLSAAEFGHAAGLGALVITAEDGPACPASRCGFLAFSRTFNRAARAAPDPNGDWMPGLPATAGLRPGGRAVFDHLNAGVRRHASFGVASWTAATVRVAVAAFDASGARIDSRELDLAPFGHLFGPIPGRLADARLEVRLVAPPPAALVFPYVSVVDETAARATHLLPATDLAKVRQLAGLPPLPQPADRPRARGSQ